MCTFVEKPYATKSSVIANVSDRPVLGGYYSQTRQGNVRSNRGQTRQKNFLQNPPPRRRWRVVGGTRRGEAKTAPGVFGGKKAEGRPGVSGEGRGARDTKEERDNNNTKQKKSRTSKKNQIKKNALCVLFQHQPPTKRLNVQEALPVTVWHPPVRRVWTYPPTESQNAPRHG